MTSMGRTKRATDEELREAGRRILGESGHLTVRMLAQATGGDTRRLTPIVREIREEQEGLDAEIRAAGMDPGDPTAGVELPPRLRAAIGRLAQVAALELISAHSAEHERSRMVESALRAKHKEELDAVRRELHEAATEAVARAELLEQRDGEIVRLEQALAGTTAEAAVLRTELHAARMEARADRSRMDERLDQAGAELNRLRVDLAAARETVAALEGQRTAADLMASLQEELRRGLPAASPTPRKRTRRAAATGGV
jgi:hypothetical protein